MIDLHCHLLPGIDDGPETMEGALQMCRALAADGVRAVVATPHMFTDLFDVSREAILEGVARLRGEVLAAGISLEVVPGADVYVTRDLCDRIRSGEVMTIADGGRYLLTETPHDVLPEGLVDLFFNVQLLGVTPVITHPERNYEVQKDTGALVPLVEAGSLVQITAGSLEGKFGESVGRCALELLHRGLAHVVASDAHSPEGRSPGLSGARRLLEGVLPPERVASLFVAVPEAILRGEAVETPAIGDAPRSKRRWWPFG